jgi:hypothetical protein
MLFIHPLFNFFISSSHNKFRYHSFKFLSFTSLYSNLPTFFNGLSFTFLMFFPLSCSPSSVLMQNPSHCHTSARLSVKIYSFFFPFLFEFVFSLFSVSFLSLSVYFMHSFALCALYSVVIFSVYYNLIKKLVCTNGTAFLPCIVSFLPLKITSGIGDC